MKKFVCIIFILLFSLNINACSSNVEGKEVSSIKSSLELNRNNRRFRMLLGKAYIAIGNDTGNYEKAVENDFGGKGDRDDAFTFILKRNAADMEAAIALADAYIRWGDAIDNYTNNDKELRDKKYDKAREILDSQLQYHKDHPKLLYELVRLDVKNNNRELFNIHYSLATSKDKKYKKVEDYTAGEIAEYLRNSNSSTIAKDILIGVANRKSREPKIHYELSKIYLEEDKLDDAEDELIKARDYAQPLSLIDRQNPGPLMYTDKKLLADIINALGEIYLIRADRIDESYVTELKKKRVFLDKAREHFISASKYEGRKNIKPYMNLANIDYSYISSLSGEDRILKINDTIDNYITAGLRIGLLEQDTGIETLINSASSFYSGVETELFYKLGFLYYQKAELLKNSIENGIINVDKTIKPIAKKFMLEKLIEKFNKNLIVEELSQIISDNILQSDYDGENMPTYETIKNAISTLLDKNITYLQVKNNFHEAIVSEFERILADEINNTQADKILSKNNIKDKFSWEIVNSYDENTLVTMFENNKELTSSVENVIKDNLKKLSEIARNCFYISFSKRSQSERNNPNINFSLGNSYYISGNYENCLNHYNQVINYYKPLLKEKYKIKSDTDPIKIRIHQELARAYNNLGASQYKLFNTTKDLDYFGNAQRNFLEAQDYYYIYNRSISNPKASNLQNLFEGRNASITQTEGVVYEPLIYDEINRDMQEYIR